jgi:hypothetical protein
MAAAAALIEQTGLKSEKRKKKKYRILLQSLFFIALY